MQVIKTLSPLDGEHQFYAWPQMIIAQELQNLAITATRPIQAFPPEDLLLFSLRMALTWGNGAQRNPADWTPTAPTAEPPATGLRLPSLYETLRAWSNALMGLATAIERLISEDKTRMDDFLPSPQVVLAQLSAAGIVPGEVLTPDGIVNLFQRATFPAGVRRSEIMVADLAGLMVDFARHDRSAAYIDQHQHPLLPIRLLDEMVLIHLLRFFDHALSSGTGVIADPDTESRAIRIMAQRATRLHGVAVTLLHLAAAGVRDLLDAYTRWLSTDWVVTRLPGQLLDDMLRAMAVSDSVGRDVPGSPFPALASPPGVFDMRLTGYPDPTAVPMAPPVHPTQRIALGNPLLQFADYHVRIPAPAVAQWINALWLLQEYLTQVKADLAHMKNTPLGSSSPFTLAPIDPRQPAYRLRKDAYHPRTEHDVYDVWPTGGALIRCLDDWSLTLNTEVREHLPTAYVPAYYYQAERKAVQQVGSVEPVCVDLEPVGSTGGQFPGLEPTAESLALLWNTTPADLSVFVTRSTARKEEALAYALANALRYIGVLTRQEGDGAEEILAPPGREWWQIGTTHGSLLLGSWVVGPALMLGQKAADGAGPALVVRLHPFTHMLPTAMGTKMAAQLIQVPDGEALHRYHKPRWRTEASEDETRALLRPGDADALRHELPRISHWRVPASELCRIQLVRCRGALEGMTIVTAVNSGGRVRPEYAWHPCQILAVTDADLPETGSGRITLPPLEWWRA